MENGSVQENRYDAENLRYELLENGKRSGFVYHNGELLHEEGREGQEVSYHLGLGIDAFRRGEELSYYHRDEQFSTALISGGQGEIRNSYQYDAFGVQPEAAEQFHNRIRYTGQQYDDLTGQYYLRARYYNPVLGRFMQEDVYQGDGLNLYAYCGNNPVVYCDPSGYAQKSCKNAKIADGQEQADATVPSAQKVPEEYEIVPYGNKAPGFQNHHGVLDRWLSENVEEYVSRGSDTTSIRLSIPHHDATRSVYGAWKTNLVGFSGKVDWSTVTPEEIFELSELMFDAAEVPQAARNDLYME